MTLWATSDWHHAHKNVIKYCNRPFKDIDEMHAALIKNYNALVKPEDTCYFLGDISFDKDYWNINAFISRLNGRKILIIGNHDDAHRDKFHTAFHECFDERWQGNLTLNDEKVYVVMDHYPLLQWNKGHHGSLHLHGHCHSNNEMNKGTRRYDVGVDGNDYKPVNIADLWAKLKKNDSHKHH